MSVTMSKQFWKALLTAPALLGATAAASTIAGTSTAVQAAEATNATPPVATLDPSLKTVNAASSLSAKQASIAKAPAASPRPTPPTATLGQAAAYSVESSASANIVASAASPQPTPPIAKLGQVAAYSVESTASTDMLGQVTSVSQLSDVKPADWAFQALQSLVERYGCIVGYPDKTYRGNRALTRYEFAAGLNACMDRVNELIAAGTADLVKKEDLLALQKLQEEFAAELATLRGRVDAVEARTATLEKQQFSTTTKLSGEVIFSIADTFGDRATLTGNNSFLAVNGVNAANVNALRRDQTQTIFSDRVRLSLDTSFTGKDRLRTRLQARNTTPFNGRFTGTNETRLGFDGSEDNAVQIDKLFYRFPVGDKLTVQIDALNAEPQDGMISSLSPFESSGAGAVSRLGRFNSFYRLSNPNNVGSAGITFAYKLNDALRLEGGYLSGVSSNNPSDKGGLFNGSYAAMAQVVFQPSQALTLGLAYAHSFYPGTEPNGGGRVNLTGSTGTDYASNPFNGAATAADSVAASVQFKLSPKLLVGGWASASFAHQRSNSNNATILSALGYLAFPDLGKKGNLGGILFGIAPTVIDTDFINAAGLRRDDRSTPLHLEAFYRYRLTDNIAITPGVFVLFSPEGNSRNDTQVVGVIRTTFTF
jgi:Carbohydrate-selective porin, OprB family/S-layer homology domain